MKLKAETCMAETCRAAVWTARQTSGNGWCPMATQSPIGQNDLQQCAQGRPVLASVLLLRMFIKIPIAAMLLPGFKA